MKITKTYLRQVIKEELEKALKETEETEEPEFDLYNSATWDDYKFYYDPDGFEMDGDAVIVPGTVYDGLKPHNFIIKIDGVEPGAPASAGTPGTGPYARGGDAYGYDSEGKEIELDKDTIKAVQDFIESKIR